MLSVEELLKPRWKVIADYPNSPFFIGQVFAIPNFDRQFTKDYWAAEKNKFPNIFEPLPWWKDRDVNEFPEYLKVYYKERVEFHKVNQWLHMIGDQTVYEYFNKDGLQLRETTRGTDPATKEEYDAYLQTTNQLKDGKD